MTNKVKLNFTTGWYKDNPLNILKISFGEVIRDAPSGWLCSSGWFCIVLFQIVIGKLEISLCIY